MKERFAKLLLGEDTSGGGKGVCTALAISNAITNLSGLFFIFINIFSLFALNFMSLVLYPKKLYMPYNQIIHVKSLRVSYHTVKTILIHDHEWIWVTVFQFKLYPLLCFS